MKMISIDIRDTEPLSPKTATKSSARSSNASLYLIFLCPEGEFSQDSFQSCLSLRHPLSDNPSIFAPCGWLGSFSLVPHVGVVDNLIPVGVVDEIQFNRSDSIKAFSSVLLAARGFSTKTGSQISIKVSLEENSQEETNGRA